MKENSNKDDVQIVGANLEAWNQHAIYWRFHRNSISSQRMVLKKYVYFQAFSKIEMLLGGFDDTSIVDIGCGGGTEMDFLLLKECRSLVGVDISKEMLKSFHYKIKGMGRGKAAYSVVASAENLPFRRQVFGYATIFHTLHHCPRRQKVIKEMARVSKGVILLEPNKESVVHRIAYFVSSLHRKTFSVTEFPENLIEFYALGFTEKEIRNDLTLSGMANTYACTTGILPTWFPLPRMITKILLALEGLVVRIPILKGQLGSILVVSHM